MNILFNEEDKKAWIDWQKRNDKFQGVAMMIAIMIATITLVLYALVITSYTGSSIDAHLSLLWSMTAKYIEAIVTYEIMATSLLFHGISRVTKKEPNIVKKAIVEVDPNNDYVNLSIIYAKKKTVICTQTISVEAFIRDICNVGTNQLNVNGVFYDIGVNNRNHVYGSSDNEYRILPETKPSDVNKVKEIVKVIKVLYKHLNL